MATITPVNPDNMAKPRGYSHAMAVEGNYKTVYVGGQNAVDEKGNVVGRGSLEEQTRCVLDNIEKIMAVAGGKLEDVVKLNIHILQGQNPGDGFRAFQQKWAGDARPPVITVVFVAGLGNPDWLVEIDAIAIIAV